LASVTILGHACLFIQGRHFCGSDQRGVVKLLGKRHEVIRGGE
jgi:hypothetical protein